MLPLASSLATIAAGAFGHRNAQEQTRNAWFRNEPPKAEWNIASPNVNCLASRHR